MKHKADTDSGIARRPGRPSVDRREEILEAARRLYDQVGFDKTTIGDVARVLGMSPANLYRSFPNRQAIDEAIAGRKLAVIEEAAWTAARASAPADQRLRAVARVVLSETKRLMFSEERMHQLCAVAARERWPVVERYLHGLQGAIRHIVMDGQRDGLFRKADPEALADGICDAFTKVWHPHMIEMFADQDLEAVSDRICELLLSGLLE